MADDDLASRNIKCPSCETICDNSQDICNVCGTPFTPPIFEPLGNQSGEEDIDLESIPISFFEQFIFIGIYSLYSVAFYGLYFLIGVTGIFSILIFPLILFYFIGVGYISFRNSNYYSNIAISSAIGFSLPVIVICFWQRFHYIPVLSLLATVIGSAIGSECAKSRTS